MSSTPSRPSPYATFRPRWGRLVAGILAITLVGACVMVAFAVTGAMASAGNRTSLIAFGLLGAFLLWRLGSVYAAVDPDGITVRNFGGPRRLAWAEVVTVRFGPNEPWVRLDLSDGDTISVLAIQRADGARSAHEASRLASLVTAHGEATDPHA